MGNVKVIVYRMILGSIIFIIIGLAFRNILTSIGMTINLFFSLMAISSIIVAKKEPNDGKNLLIASILGFMFFFFLHIRNLMRMNMQKYIVSHFHKLELE